MAAYFLDVILKENTTATSSTDFRNGNWTLNPPGYSTIRIEDDDNLGLGDNDPYNETDATPGVGDAGIAQVTHIDGVPIPAGHPLANGIFAKFVRCDDGDGDTDNFADVVVLGGTGALNQSDAMVAYPGSGWSMNVGDTYDSTANATPSDHPGGRSWSQEASVGGTPITPPCFTPGSLIQTKRGLLPIEKMQEGDMVVTRDFGLQPVKWVHRTDLSQLWFAVNADLCPIMISKDALGDGLPERDSMVSPGHLVLIKDKDGEILVPARQLQDRPGIYQVKPLNGGYVHLMFENHQVLFVDGMWSESFQPNYKSLVGIGAGARSELFRIFPEIRYNDGLRAYKTARPTVYRKAARRAVARISAMGALQ